MASTLPNGTGGSLRIKRDAAWAYSGLRALQSIYAKRKELIETHSSYLMLIDVLTE